MLYSFPQKMVNTVRTWPEYKKLIEILREMVNTVRTWPENKKLLEILREKRVDVDQVIEILRTLYQLSLRGNVFNVWKCNGISLYFVLTYIKFHDTE